MRKRNVTAVIAAVLLAVTLFASCASAKPETPEPISEPETDTSVFDPTETTEDSALPEEEETEETEPEDAELPVEIVPVAESESEITSETEEATESEKASETEKASESEKPKETEKKTEKKTENKTTEKKTEEKKETEKKTEEKKAATAEKDSSGKPKYKYYLIVDKKGNTVTVYTYDDNGKYTKPVFSMICSTGGGTMSKGVYNIRNTNSYKWHGLFGGVYGQYVTQIKGNILFHSVPYKKNGDKGSLKYAEFDKLGTSCSMGCVRLQVKDAKWIYDNRKNVSGVEFTNTGSTGPLGRPSAPKISGNTACRGWDPTDPDPNNPWKKGQKDETTETETVTEPVTETATEPASESDKTSESATEPTSETTSEPASETEKTSENATEPASETEKTSESATEPASETTPEPSSEPEKEPESTSKPESETQKESESTTKQAESEKPADTEKPQDSEKPAEAEKPEESENP